jgi:hypothetical protein
MSLRGKQSAWVVLFVVLAQPAEPVDGISSLASMIAFSDQSVAAQATASSSSLEKTSYPQLVDVTASTGLRFEHLSSPDQRFIVESMSGGVALIDYDRDGWPDIYFTNAQTVEMAQNDKKARSALFHNNRDGTFTDVTDKAGVGYPCWAMGQGNRIWNPKRVHTALSHGRSMTERS